MAERAYIVTKGVVLRETETKEADKILTLLTADRGKISVIARGVRRKSCKYAACAQQLAYSEWTLYQKGDWYYANEGATIELFNGLRTDLEALALGCYFAELTEAVTAAGNPRRTAAVPSAERAVRPLRFTQATGPGKARLRDQAAVPGGVRAPGGQLRLLRPAGPGAASAGRGPGGPAVPELRGQGERPVHAPVPGLPGGAAAYCVRGPQAALLLPADGPGPGAALRRGGGLCGRPAGAGLPDAGLLQEPPAAGNAVEMRYILY